MSSEKSCCKRRALIRLSALLIACITFVFLTACGGYSHDQPSDPEEAIDDSPTEEVPETTEPEQQTMSSSEENEAMKELRMEISGTKVNVSWEDNESVAALKDAAANETITVQMSMYGGFEQVGSLGTSLPRNDTQLTTQAGDIVLYSGSQIVVFYGSNSWAYTRLGRIEGMSGDELKDLLGNGDAELVLSVE